VLPEPARLGPREAEQHPLDRRRRLGQLVGVGRRPDLPREPLSREHREHPGEPVAGALYDEAGPLDRADQPRPGVAAVVAGPHVVVGPCPRVGRHREQQPPAWPQHASQLGQRDRLGLAVLDHVEGADQVEAAVAEGQRQRRRTHALARPQPAGVEVDRDVVVAVEPRHAGPVGAADVEHAGGVGREVAEGRPEQVGTGAVPPVVRLLDRRRPLALVAHEALLTAATSASATRSTSAGASVLKNGSRTSRELTSLDTGHSVGRAANRRPPSESWSGT